MPCYKTKFHSGSPTNWKFGGEKEKETKCLLWISKKFIQTRNFFRRIVGQGLAPAESILINYNLKNGLNSMFKPFLALFVFCSGAVPTYSSHSQNTKFISLSRSLTAYRNLLLDFFKKLIKTSLFFCNFIIYNKW